MLKQLRQYLEANTDSNAYRWLCKREPALWSNVVQATNFLPETASARQRCWHILNDSWSVPVCKVTAEPVAWCENQYQTYSSNKARAADTELWRAKIESFNTSTGSKGHWSRSDTIRKAKSLKAKLRPPPPGRKWSVERRDRVICSWHKKFGITEEHLAFMPYKEYRQKVNSRSKWHFKHERDLIADSHLLREDGNHLDHVFSILDCWKNRVNPVVAGHFTNLRMIYGSENLKKSRKSDKSLDQLYCDYLDAI